MTKKQVPEWNFRKKIAFTAIFGQKSTFLTFFKKHPFFFNSKDGTHVLIELLVKLNADSEFLVHFYVGTHFEVFCPCLL
jgi:hypothetical protein